MKHLMKRIALFTLTVLTLASILPTAALADTRTELVTVAASSLEAPRISRISIPLLNKINYALKVYNFLKDSRFKNGTAWAGSKRPQLSTWSCKGCMAYAVDFCKYVYGADWASSPKKFQTYKKVSEIETGDAIRIDGHYFVVLQRKGDKLYTAEGSYSSKVRASLATYGYYIKDNQLYQNRYNSKGVSTGSVKVTFVSGYRFK